MVSWKGTANLTNVKFTDNTAPSAYGGGYFGQSGRVTMVNCQFLRNSATGTGKSGGAYFLGACKSFPYILGYMRLND